MSLIELITLVFVLSFHSFWILRLMKATGEQNKCIETLRDLFIKSEGKDRDLKILGKTQDKILKEDNPKIDPVDYLHACHLLSYLKNEIDNLIIKKKETKENGLD